MKKFWSFVGIVSLGIISAGIFGIIHNQISYTISPEYFTKFKFQQFEIPEYFLNRVGVAFIGWNATWWVGLILGTILAIFMLRDNLYSSLWIKAVKTIGVILLVASAVGLMGLIIGSLLLDPNSSNWMIPESVADKESFLAVGSMHNFSYLGGIIGLIIGVLYRNKV